MTFGYLLLRVPSGESNVSGGCALAFETVKCDERLFGRTGKGKSAMKFLIVGLFVVVVVFLVRRSKHTANPAEEACAIEIGELIKSNPEAGSQAIAEVFSKHGIASSRCYKVGAMVMPQLRKHGMKAEDARLVMTRVRSAYSQVS